jgi:hypothetical protein
MSTAIPPIIDPSTIPLLTLPFVPFTDRRDLPRCAAIYFVLNAAGTVLYIGQSTNLAVRWSAHHGIAKLTEQRATRLAWLTVDDPDTLSAVESACIAYFFPVCNDRAASPTARLGRPRRNLGPQEAMLVRMPAALASQLRELAYTEDRYLNTVMLRLLRAGLLAEGHALAAPEARLDTGSHS